MKRPWLVRPDTGMQLSDGTMIEFVSREALVEAFMDALAIIDRAGGVLSIVAGRVQTDVPGEMLTNGLMIEWKDRAHATTSAERATQVVAPQRSEARDEATVALGPDPTPEELEAHLIERGETHLGVEVGDGLDPATLDEVDESSIPESVR
jgi:hypothetical protein